MKLNIKDYKITKVKEYFKTNQLFFFVNGINRNSIDWLLTEQGLKEIGFNYYKVLNKTIIKTVHNSTYSTTKPIIGGSTFLIKPQSNKHFLKQTILNGFNPLFFELLVVKFNNKLYSVTLLKDTYSLEYKETKLLLYQFNLTLMKICFEISK